MRAIHTLSLRLRSLFRRQQVDQELDEELGYHLERLVEENTAAGMSPGDARNAALRAMGGLEQSKHLCRDARGWRWLDDLIQDQRFAFRIFTRAPLFTSVAIASLALGIGANTAIFSVVNGLLLRRLPYPASDRLVWIEEGMGGLEPHAVQGGHFVDWSQHSHTLEGIAAFSYQTLALTGMGEPERLDGFYVSEGFFPTLGVGMFLGRNFLPVEERPHGDPVVILSHSLWVRRFGSDPGVLGRSIVLNDTAYQIVGVASPEPRFFEKSELWIPLNLDSTNAHAEQQQLIGTFGRLKPGVTREQARAELQGIADNVSGKALSLPPGSLRVAPLHDYLAGGTRQVLLLLLAVVSLILLIASANVANLLLARAAVRQKEFAVRAALGAARVRLIRQMLSESLLLAAAGGVGGIVIAWAVSRCLAMVTPPGAFGDVAGVITLGIDGRVLIFTIATSVASSLLFGLAPAIQFSQPDLTKGLKEGGRSGRSPRRRTRHVILVAQVGLAVVLLVAAGLLVRSFANVLRVNPGFKSDRTLTVLLELSGRRYGEAESRARFQQRLIECVATLPGVAHVGASDRPPLGHWPAPIISWPIDGNPGGKDTAAIPVSMASPEYFRVLGIPLRAGRFFQLSDTADAPRVVILSESEARYLFPNQDPIGQPVFIPNFFKKIDPTARIEPATVVGVVDDIRRGLEDSAGPELYLPFQQAPFWSVFLVVDSFVPPQALEAAIRKELLSVDPDQPVRRIMTMEERLSEHLATRRFTLLLLGGFAALALGLATVGVYGVVAYLVSERTHEIGVRMALGAQPSNVVRLFVTQGMAFVLCGIAMGLFVAWGLSRTMTTLLFGVAAADALTFGTVAMLLAFVALAACWIPARRATRADPLMALRQE